MRQSGGVPKICAVNGWLIHCGDEVVEVILGRSFPQHGRYRIDDEFPEVAVCDDPPCVLVVAVVADDMEPDERVTEIRRYLRDRSAVRAAARKERDWHVGLEVAPYGVLEANPQVGCVPFWVLLVVKTAGFVARDFPSERSVTELPIW